jgi:formamidopyrimidine-DNA glycosylase
MPMPELPEVETVLQGLMPVMQGFQLISVEQNRPDLRYAFPDNFVERLEGHTITALSRRAKYLIIELDSGDCMILHLGMSGRVQIHLGAYKPKTHDHVVFHLSNHVIVSYNDSRRFGFMDLCAKELLDQHRAFRALGPEPLAAEFSALYLAEVLKHKSSPIKTVLLDQRIVAGLGNIYVCEALFMAHIHPSRPAQDINSVEMALLVKSIKDVLTKAIAAGGSTLRDHQQPNGDMGYFQHNFLVYGREGEPCVTCMAPIWRMQQAGRSTFYCSHCQV